MGGIGGWFLFNFLPEAMEEKPNGEAIDCNSIYSRFNSCLLQALLKHTGVECSWNFFFTDWPDGGNGRRG
jgi:hypothetical protein